MWFKVERLQGKWSEIFEGESYVALGQKNKQFLDFGGTLVVMALLVFKF